MQALEYLLDNRGIIIQTLIMSKIRRTIGLNSFKRNYYLNTVGRLILSFNDDQVNGDVKTMPLVESLAGEMQKSKKSRMKQDAQSLCGRNLYRPNQKIFVKKIQIFLIIFAFINFETGLTPIKELLFITASFNDGQVNGDC